MTITDHLRAERESRTTYQRLRSPHIAVALGGAAVLPQQVLWGRTMEGHGEWKGGFDEHYEDLWDRVRQVGNGHRGLYESALADRALDEANRIVGLSRNAGVSARWKFEQLFAREGGEDVQGRMGYWDYRDGQNQWVEYSDSNLRDLSAGGKVQHDGRTLQGHHKTGVAPSLESREFGKVGDPENIRLQTPESHRDSPTLGHGGNTHAPTTGEADEVTTGYRSVLKGKFEGAREQVHEIKAEIGLVAGLMAGSIEIGRAHV